MLWYNEAVSLTCRLSFVLFIFLFAPIMFVLGLPVLLLVKSARPAVSTKLTVALIAIIIILTLLRVLVLMVL